MTAVYAGQWSGGGTSSTTDRAASGTPAVGDLLFVACQVATNTNAAPTCSDDQGGTYTLVLTAASNSGADMGSLFVRNQPVEVATAHNVTVATGANDAGVVGVIRISGMSRFGSSAIRSKGKQENQATSTTPAPVLDLTPLTTNVQIAGVFSRDTTTSPPASWTERIEANQATPTTALEVATRDSGNTSATITFGAAENTAFASFAVELDCSAITFTGTYPTTGAAMATACGYGTWTAGYLCNESSGNLAPTFGSGNLTASGLTYSQSGMLSGESAVLFDANTDAADGGNIHDVTTDDLAFVFVTKLSARDETNVSYLLNKLGGAGWSITDNVASSIDFTVAAATGATPSISYTGTDEWLVIMGVVDRGAGKARLAMYAPSVGFVGTAAATVAGTLTNSASFILGGIVVGTTNFTVDALYVATGSGAAASMSANLMTALSSFVSYVRAPAAASTGNLLLLGVG